MLTLGAAATADSMSDEMSVTGAQGTDRAVDVRAHAALVGDVLHRRDAAELRPQIGLDLTAQPNRWSTFKFDGSAEALVATRSGRVNAGFLRLRDVWGEVRWRALDVRAGYGRLVWGRLDEISPSDVINPLDLAAFLLEGRSRARLPVWFTRVRISPSDRFALEGVLLPRFRRGVFDALGEPTSPFNLFNDLVLPAGGGGAPVEQREPPTSLEHLSGGVRLQFTVGRVDVAASTFRGFEPFGPLVFEPSFGEPSGAVVGRLLELHPRFTMFAADMETVSGAWTWRAELAVRPERFVNAATSPIPVASRTIDAGVGFDRRAGDYRVFGSVLVHRAESDAEPAIARTDTSLIGSVERSFARDRYLARGFMVVNPVDRSAFVRGLVEWTVRDHIAIDGSAGAFLGTSEDSIGRFKQRDFLLGRIRYDF
jgi:hypothetical protein